MAQLRKSTEQSGDGAGLAARLWLALACACVLGACGSGSSDSGLACDPGSEFCNSIPASAFACTDSQYWPLVEQSGERPLSVHYSRIADAGEAAGILAVLEDAWQVQVDTVGFSAPLEDGGICGPDDRYDVFLWRGIDGAFVEAIADNPATDHDDFTTYMAINPFGNDAGDFLDTTLAHELNHALQASDDWWESALIFEMTATFAESLVYPEQDDWFFTIEDFQRHPEWSLFYDDNYETWYMYGAAMYLHFLKERYYSDDAAFIARIWRSSRSDPAVGRPDYIDAMRSVLMSDLGIGLDETIVEFMQWRWFVADFDDGQHFARGADWPRAVAFQEVDAGVAQANVALSAMIYGAGYTRIVNNGTAERLFAVDISSQDEDVAWRLTTAAGDAVAGSVTVPPGDAVVLVATVLPLAELSTETLAFDLRTGTLLLNAL